jgi:hypothetical protein
MVRIFSQYLVLALSAIGLVHGAPSRRNLAQVEADIAKVQTDTNTFVVL